MMEAQGSVVYVSHNGLTEPLGRRQVLPYLMGLATYDWRIRILSYEKTATATPEAISAVEQMVRESGLTWTRLPYRGHPAVLSTAIDIARGTTVVRRGAKPDLIHARSTVAALIARLASPPRATPWIFDVRGFLAEEYVDAGHWARGGLLYRLTKAIESRLLRSAAGVVTLTRAASSRLPVVRIAGAAQPRIVIPCAVDLQVFRPSAQDRAAVRSSLGWTHGPAVVYSGSLGSWYRLEEMLDFFEVARQELPSLHLLLLTPQPDLAARAVGVRHLGAEVAVRKAEPDEVPRHLAACDAGLCFLGRHSSKVASSPTKFGEYLASGLPVITNDWIGDAADLASERPWILVGDFAREAYRKAACRLRDLLAQSPETQARARELAQCVFGLDAAVKRYHQLYLEVLGR